MSGDKSTKLINVHSVDDRVEIVADVLFYSIGEGAIIIDERGNISRVNKIALDILGYSEAELIGKWYANVLVAEDEYGKPIANLDRPMTEAIISGKPVSKRIHYVKKTGKRIPVAINVAPIIVDDKPIGAIELFRDITDEIQLERAKDEFISIASHQLRTPATVVKQNLGMILEGFVDSEDIKREMLEIAYEHNNNQLEIINDLLNIAQIEASKLKPNLQDFDVTKLLQKVISGQLATYKTKGIDLHLADNKAKVNMRADPLHLQMVFENIISNAQKYSPPNTKVSVNIEDTGEAITISIKDQGYGIAPNDIPQLFRKFSRIHNIESTASGTGLGLYWAKKLVELHGGKIDVVSKLRKGTTFSVTIPQENI
jgi:PAS domain S-box-containing protein